jgi:hypothetical protein
MVSDMKLTCPAIHDKFGIVARRYESGKALPYSVYVDRAGIVKAVSVGFGDSVKASLPRHVADILGAGR